MSAPLHLHSTGLTQPLARLRQFSAGPDFGLAGKRGEFEPWEADELPTRRCRIWELATALHCSIVGTCLTTAELRSILTKLQITDADRSSDHDLHTLGVMLAGNHDIGGKLLQKALDRRHRTTIACFAKAKDATSVVALWEESLARGDIPGAYWATLTHPAATHELVRQVFGAVHMLSHLVGAANRADIQRLRRLEAENAALTEKIERQQNQLREGFAARDAKIRDLTDFAAREARAPSTAAAERNDNDQAQRQLINDLVQRAEQESQRRIRAERRLEAATSSRQAADKVLQQTSAECNALRAELNAAEAHLAAQADTNGTDVALDLLGSTLLYVGGRANQIPQLRALIESANGQFIHHDGGIEHGMHILPGLISRADNILFPIDCVSHGAVAIVKRLCRQSDKRYVPLRTASLASLLTALARNHGVIAAAAE